MKCGVSIRCLDGYEAGCYCCPQAKNMKGGKNITAACQMNDVSDCQMSVIKGQV